MDKAKILKFVEDKGFSLLFDYLSSLGADITNRFIFGGDDSHKELLKQVQALLEDDKVEQAVALASTIKADLAGWGEGDEEKLAQDLMDIIRTDLVALKPDGQRKVSELTAYFARLEVSRPDVMRRVRKGHAKETSHEIRQNKLATAALLATDTERENWLKAAGYFSKTEWELILEKDAALFTAAATQAKLDADTVWVEIRRRYSVNTPPPHPVTLGGKIKAFAKLWLNPLG